MNRAGNADEILSLVFLPIMLNQRGLRAWSRDMLGAEHTAP